MFIGIDYYPEHWPRKRWKEDVQLMKEAGFNAVRMGEFAWSRMEPEEGVYEFDWLDEVIEILSREGIKSVLGTPTAAPPKWLTQKYPEILPVDEWGRMANPGGRRHYCLNSPIYWEYTRKIAKKLASHYKDKKEVIGWQIDNELGNPYCYCENCKEAFRKWLKGKYKSLENLNKRWGNAFWSQEYTSWSQIPLPSGFIPDGDHHPALKLEYRRFFSDSNFQYIKLQVDILRKITPGKFITHNFLDPSPCLPNEIFEKIDYYKVSSLLDFISFDNYPHGEPTGIAFNLDVMRGIGKGKFWVLEQKSGATMEGPSPEPGQLRLWTYQAVARGAESIFYFRWRSCPFAQEQEHQGILNYDGKPRRRYEEIKKTISEIRKLSFHLRSFSSPSQVAILHSYQVRWAFRASTIPEGFDYLEHILDFYRPFYEKGMGVDIINPEEITLNKYRVVIIPSLLILKKSIISRLKEFVKGGGLLIATFLTGRKDWEGMIIPTILPSELQELFGIEIIDYFTLPTKIPVHFQPELSKEIYQAFLWQDIIETHSAQPLATYQEGWQQEKACISINSYGKGEAIYIGAKLERPFYNCLLEWIKRKVALSEPPFAFPEGVEVKEFFHENEKRGYYLLNHTKVYKKITLSSSYKDALSGEIIREPLSLGPYECLVVHSVNVV